MMSTGKQKALNKATNDAIFVQQLPTDKAVKFVMSRVRGVKKEEVLEALKSTMVWYKTA